MENIKMVPISRHEIPPRSKPPRCVGSIRLCKSKKALLIFIENRAFMVSLKSLLNLLDEKTPYVKLWTSEAKQENTTD